MSPIPFRSSAPSTVGSRWTTGTIVRVITFQSFVRENGITGWTFTR